MFNLILVCVLYQLSLRAFIVGMMMMMMMVTITPNHIKSTNSG